jgi:tetratricopeptide (TPR) repeat protein
MRIAIVRSIFLIVITSVSFLVVGIKSGFAANSADEYRQLGLSYRQQGKYSEAIAVLQKSVELEPQNLSGIVLLGWTQHLAQKREAAATSLLTAIYQNPVYVPAYNALGILFLIPLCTSS